MSAILIYFILTTTGRFEFFSITRINDVADGMAACQQMSRSVARAFKNKPGNMLAICAKDQEVKA